MQQLSERGVYLVGLEEVVTLEMIYSRVSQIRPVEMINVPQFFKPEDKRGQTKGYAFVYFKSKQHAEDVIKALDHKPILFNPIRALPIDINFSTKSNLFIKNLNPACTVKRLEAYIQNLLNGEKKEGSTGLYRAEIVFDRNETTKEVESRKYGYIQFKNQESIKKVRELLKDPVNLNEEVGLKIEVYEFKSYNERDHYSDGLVIFNLTNIPKERELEQRVQVIERLKQLFHEAKLIDMLDLDNITVFTTKTGLQVVSVKVKNSASSKENRDKSEAEFKELKAKNASDARELFKYASENTLRFEEMNGLSVRVAQSGVYDNRGLVFHNLSGKATPQLLLKEAQAILDKLKRKGLKAIDCMIKQVMNEHTGTWGIMGTVYTNQKLQEREQKELCSHFQGSSLFLLGEPKIYFQISAAVREKMKKRLNNWTFKKSQGFTKKDERSDRYGKPYNDTSGAPRNPRFNYNLLTSVTKNFPGFTPSLPLPTGKQVPSGVVKAGTQPTGFPNVPMTALPNMPMMNTVPGMAGLSMMMPMMPGMPPMPGIQNLNMPGMPGMTAMPGMAGINVMGLMHGVPPPKKETKE